MYPCHACNGMTIYFCMECARPTCPSCQFSMHAMCQECRAAYKGPIWQLGGKADKYIRAELLELFLW